MEIILGIQGIPVRGYSLEDFCNLYQIPFFSETPVLPKDFQENLRMNFRHLWMSDLSSDEEVNNEILSQILERTDCSAEYIMENNALYLVSWVESIISHFLNQFSEGFRKRAFELSSKKLLNYFTTNKMEKSYYSSRSATVYYSDIFSGLNFSYRMILDCDEKKLKRILNRENHSKDFFEFIRSLDREKFIGFKMKRIDNLLIEFIVYYKASLADLHNLELETLLNIFGRDF